MLLIDSLCTKTLLIIIMEFRICGVLWAFHRDETSIRGSKKWQIKLMVFVLH